MEQQNNKFEGWAVVEVMGHNTHIGYVTTENYGQACLFRIDTPGLDEREYELTAPEYVESSWTPAGSKVKRAASPAHSVLVGPGSVYRLSPCTEETARQQIEKLSHRPLILITRASGALLQSADDDTDDSDHDEEEF